MEIKNAGEFIVFKLKGVWGRGGERRNQARAVEEKTSADRRSQTRSNSIQHHKVFRYSFSEAIPIFFNRIRSGFFRSLYKFSPVIGYGSKFVKM